METQASNPEIQSLIAYCEQKEKESGQALWGRLAYNLVSQRRRAEVSVSHIDSHAEDRALVIVPGKVLGSRKISKQVRVAALSFSTSARQAIEEQGEVCNLSDIDEQEVQNRKVQVLC